MSFTGTNLTAVSPSVQCSNSSGRVIIVDIYNTVEKILGKASLIAMPWNGGSEMVEKLFSKRTAVPDLLCKFVWDWSALLLDLVFFPLHWSGTTRRRISNEISESEWHLLLLFHRRPLVVGLNCLVRLVSRYGLDVPRLAIMVGEHCDRCSSQAVVCEMWLYTCSLWHLFHHVVERSCTKRCAAKPDFVDCGIELLALTISWSMKQSILRWIEMTK